VLKALEPFIPLLTTVAVGVILVIFRAQVRQLIDWVVRFRRIEKTKEGYAVEALGQPSAAILGTEKKEQAIAAVEAVETVTGAPITTSVGKTRGSRQ
jgi:hypothetical protein